MLTNEGQETNLMHRRIPNIWCKCSTLKEGWNWTVFSNSSQKVQFGKGGKKSNFSVEKPEKHAKSPGEVIKVNINSHN